MNPSSLSFRARQGNQSGEGNIDTISKDRGSTSRVHGERAPNAYDTLHTLYMLAEEARNRLERLKSIVPGLASACEECFVEEMTYVAVAHFTGLRSTNPLDASRNIEEAIIRMDAFRLWVRRITPAVGTGSPRILLDHGPSSNQARETSGMGARRRLQQPEEPETLESLSGELDNDIVKDDIEQPEELVVVNPGPPQGRVNLGKATIASHSRTGLGVRRLLTLESVMDAFKRSLGESRREKVIDLWIRARDCLGKEYLSAEYTRKTY
ncbi:hypothetical protein L873DRAFT_1814086, partial [Choiromyces venosus 120613-1]